MKQNDILELQIDDIGMDCEGIAHTATHTVFVPFALPNERVRAKIKHVKRNVAFAAVLEVLAPSADRVQSPCACFGKCGGCDALHIKYEKQLEVKRESVARTIKKIAGDITDVLPFVPSDLQLAYRNKASIPFGNVSGKAVLGFFAENTHKIVPLRGGCPLHGDWLLATVEVVTEFAARRGLRAFDESTGEGLLRHLVARNICGFVSVTLVINGTRLPHQNELAYLLSSRLGRCNLYLSCNKKRGNAVFGDAPTLLHGAPAEAVILGVRATINPLSFLQVNDGVRDKIYARIAEFVPHAGTVIDAYGGVGILGAVLAARGNKVFSIDIVREAVEDGTRLAAENGLTERLTHICGDAANELPKLLKSLANGGGAPLTVLLDPPRRGCDARLLEAVVAAAKHTPMRLAYISCNPATLARDLALLAPAFGGGRVTVQPYDMFPQTKHAECVVLLTTQTIL